jgi:hypothetical protein
MIYSVGGRGVVWWWEELVAMSWVRPKSAHCGSGLQRMEKTQGDEQVNESFGCPDTKIWAGGLGPESRQAAGRCAPLIGRWGAPAAAQACRCQNHSKVPQIRRCNLSLRRRVKILWQKHCIIIGAHQETDALKKDICKMLYSLPGELF